MNPPSHPVRHDLARADGVAVDWAISAGPVAYPEAVEAMERRVAAIIEGQARELIWLLEHPALYTAGVSAKPADLLSPDRLPVFQSGRGGQFTFHGPGQRVVYVMLDLRRRGRDARAFVGALEAWIIAALGRLGVTGETHDGRVGVWVARDGRPGPQAEVKIAAIGVKLRRWVSFHGISVNVAPDLAAFDGIVPCGLAGYGVTSLADLGHPTTLAACDAALKSTFAPIFGALVDADPPGRA